jgi:hypothetical protein
MRLHLGSNRRFVGRLQVEDALGMPHRRFVVVAPGSLFGEPHEGPVRLGAKPRPLVKDPVVVAGGKEITRIQTRREVEIAGSDGIAEPQHVDLTRPRRDPPHDLVVDLDELADVGQGLAEVMQQLSEVGPRLTFVGVGPELEREAGAVLQLPPQRDHREEPLQAKRVEGAKMAPVEDDFDCAE